MLEVTSTVRGVKIRSYRLLDAVSSVKVSYPCHQTQTSSATVTVATCSDAEPRCATAGGVGRNRGNAVALNFWIGNSALRPLASGHR